MAVNLAALGDIVDLGGMDGEVESRAWFLFVPQNVVELLALALNMAYIFLTQYMLEYKLS